MQFEVGDEVFALTDTFAKYKEGEGCGGLPGNCLALCWQAPDASGQGLQQPSLSLQAHMQKLWQCQRSTSSGSPRTLRSQRQLGRRLSPSLPGRWASLHEAAEHAAGMPVLSPIGLSTGSMRMSSVFKPA